MYGLKFSCYHLGVLFSTWCKGSSAETKWSAVEAGGLLINTELKFKEKSDQYGVHFQIKWVDLNMYHGVGRGLGAD